MRIPAGKGQNENVGTRFRKRSEVDSTLDFRMTAGGIVTHVRSFSAPWPLAPATIGGEIYRIADAAFAPFVLPKRKNKWSTLGTVLRRKKGNWVLVRCYRSAVWLKLNDC